MNIFARRSRAEHLRTLADRAETRGARERLSKHLMKIFIDGEKDEHRLTVHGLTFLQDFDREIDFRR